MKNIKVKFKEWVKKTVLEQAKYGRNWVTVKSVDEDSYDWQSYNPDLVNRPYIEVVDDDVYNQYRIVDKDIRHSGYHVKREHVEPYFEVINIEDIDRMFED
jgi:hypothetical protein